MKILPAPTVTCSIGSTQPLQAWAPPLKHCGNEPETSCGTRSSTCPSQSSSRPLHFSSIALFGLALTLHTAAVLAPLHTMLPALRHTPMPAVQAFPSDGKPSLSVTPLPLPSSPSPFSS